MCALGPDPSKATAKHSFLSGEDEKFLPYLRDLLRIVDMGDDAALDRKIDKHVIASFKQWAEGHQRTIEESPTLKKLQKRILKFELEGTAQEGWIEGAKKAMGGAARAMSARISSGASENLKSQDHKKALERALLSSEIDKGAFKRFFQNDVIRGLDDVKMLFEHIEIGSIPESFIPNILTWVQPMDRESLQLIASLLVKLSSESIVRSLLNIQNRFKMYPLNSDLIPLLWPALEKLEPNDLVKLMRGSLNTARKLPHQNPVIFSSLYPLIERLPAEQLIQIMQGAPIENEEVLAQALPLFTQLDAEQIIHLFKEGDVLSRNDTFISIIPLLQKLGYEQLRDLLTYGRVEALHPQLLLKLFQGLDKEVLLNFFTKGRFLDSPHAVEALVPLLAQKFTFEEVMQIVQSRNAGSYLLSDPRVIPAIKDLAGGILKCFEHPHFVRLTIVEESFDAIMDALASVSPLQIKAALTQRLPSGQSLIHSLFMTKTKEVDVEYCDYIYGGYTSGTEIEVIKNRLSPLLAKLSKEDKLEVLLCADERGRTFYHVYGQDVEKWERQWQSHIPRLSLDDCISIRRQHKTMNCDTPFPKVVEKELLGQLSKDIILSMQTEDVLSLLVDYHHHPIFQPCLEKILKDGCPLDLLQRVLIPQGTDIRSQLFKARLKVVVPILERLSFEDVCSFLTVPHLGTKLLFDQDIFSLLHPMLMKKALSEENFAILQSEDPNAIFVNRDFNKTRLIRLLKMEDANGNICLHNKEIFSLMIDFLNHLDPIGFHELVFKSNAAGITPLSTSDVFKRVLIYHRLDDKELLFELRDVNPSNLRMKIENLLRDALNTEHVKLKDLLPLLQRLPNEMKRELLWALSYPFSYHSTFDYTYGSRREYSFTRWMYHPEVFEALCSALETMSFADMQPLLFDRTDPGFERIYDKKCLLAEPIVAKKVCEIMLQRSKEEVILFLTQCVSSAVVPDLAFAKPFFDQMALSDLLQILQRSSYDMVFQNRDLVFSMIFERFPEEDIDAFLSLKRDGRIIFNALTTQQSIDLLKKLSPERIVPYLLQPASRDSFHFENQDLMTALADKVAQCSVDQLITLMQAKTKRGTPVCHTFVLSSLMPHLDLDKKRNVISLALRELDYNSENILFKIEFFPFLEELDIPLEGMRVFLKHQNVNGDTPLHNEERLKKLIPILDRMDPSDVADLLIIRNTSLGNSPLHVLSDCSIAVSLIEKLTAEDYIRVYTCKNHQGNTGKLRMHSKHFASFSGEQLTRFLRNSYLHTNSLQAFRMFAGLIKEKCTLEQLDEILTSKTAQGKNVYDIPDVMVAVVDLVREMGGNVLEYLESENRERKICIHNPAMLKVMLPHLESIDPQLAIDAVNIRDRDGNSVFHNREILSFARDFIHRHKINLSKYVNHVGLLPLEKAQFVKDWLEKRKALGGLTEPIANSEYNARMQKAEKEILTIFNSLHFGKDSGVNPQYLFTEGRVDMTPAAIARQKEVVREALNVILTNMKTKRAWLGTPDGNNHEALGLFYSEMLMNLETVLSFIRSQEDQVKAGTLVQMAAVVIEGRCAAAHQAEIRQRSQCCLMSMGKEGMTLDGMIQGALNTSLMKVVDAVFRNISESADVHVLTRLMYSVGLVASDDPLCRAITVDMAFSLITSSLDYHAFFKDLDIPQEYIDEFLRSKLPEDFDPTFPMADGKKSSYKTLLKETLGKEKDLLSLFEEKCRSFGCKQENIKPLMDFFNGYRNIHLNGLKKELPHASTLDEALSKSLENEKTQLQNLSLVQKKRLESTIATIDQSRREGVALLQQQMIQAGLPTEAHVRVLEAFIDYQSALVEMGKQLPEDSDEEGAEIWHFSFNLQSQRLPSNAIEEARRLKFEERLDTSAARKKEVLKIFGVITVESKT
jgi:hypothetical protein